MGSVAKLKIEGQKATVVNTRAIQALEAKGSSKRTPRVKDRAGDKNCNSSKHYCDCPTCHTQHPDECQLLANGGENHQDDKRKKFHEE